MQFVSQYLCDIRLYVPFDRYSRSLIEVDNLFQAIGYLVHAKVASFLGLNIRLGERVHRDSFRSVAVSAVL